MGIQLWEIEKSPDKTFDILLNGRPEGYGYDEDQVRMFFQSRGLDLSEVEGSDLLGG